MSVFWIIAAVVTIVTLVGGTVLWVKAFLRDRHNQREVAKFIRLSSHEQQRHLESLWRMFDWEED
jgi:tRNA A37 N6-isopentenylltransferase MiaA